MKTFTTPVFLLAIIVPWSPACATHAVPERLPPASAASAAAPEAPAASVTLALREDPPLPGGDTDHWTGLQASKASAPDHSHHHHDHAGNPSNGAPPAPSTAGQGHSHEPGAEPQQAKPYSCPMHPDVTSEHPGQCPRCGMNLVRTP